MKKNILVVLLSFTILSCNNQGSNTTAVSSSTGQMPVESSTGSQSTSANYPTEIIGSFSGQQASYNLKNKDGNEMIIRGNPVTVPSFDALFTLSNNGEVEFIQQSSGMKVVYNGNFQVIENTSNNIQVKCDVSTSDHTSKPTYILNFDKTTNEITCIGSSNEPVFTLNRSDVNTSSNQNNQDKNSNEINSSQNQSPDGIYTFSDNSVNIRISISGNRWRGKTAIISGFGADNDNQNA
jgi:hypothetical protein